VEEQESERLAKIIAKLNLSKALSEDEVKFLVKVIQRHILVLIRYSKKKFGYE